MQFIENQDPILGSTLKAIRNRVTENMGFVSLDDDDFFGMLKLIKELAKRRR